MARQRLLGLISAFPTRLDVRLHLAEVYRQLGEPAQAGRWSYLSDEPDPGEVEAFEDAYGRDPVRLMQAVKRRGPESEAPSAVARQRLLALRQQAEQQEHGSVRWEDPRHRPWPHTWRGRLIERVLLAAVVLVLVLIAIGAVSLFVVGLRQVLRWVS
jgi:hypothetical protein